MVSEGWKLGTLLRILVKKPYVSQRGEGACTRIIWVKDHENKRNINKVVKS